MRGETHPPVIGAEQLSLVEYGSHLKSSHLKLEVCLRNSFTEYWSWYDPDTR